MRIKKADTNILMEALNNDSCVQGRKGKLLCSYIGTVEIIKGLIFDEDGCPDYHSEYHLAAQLPTMEIIGVSQDNKAFSLAGEKFTIHWGEYPEGFDKQKTTRPAPKRFSHIPPIWCKKVQQTEVDDLPF